MAGMEKGRKKFFKISKKTKFWLKKISNLFVSRGILEKPMIIKELIKEMRTQGVDIFPDYDSHCYIEGNTDMQKVLKRKPKYNKG